MWTHSSSGERLVRCIAGSRGCSPILLKSGYRHKEYGARDARFRGRCIKNEFTRRGPSPKSVRTSFRDGYGL